MSIWGVISPGLTYGAYGVSSGVASIAISGAAGANSGAMPLYIGSYETPITGTTSLFLSSLDQCFTWSSLNQEWVRYNNTTLESWNVMPTSCLQGAYKTQKTTVFMSGSATGRFTCSMPMFVCNSGDGVVTSTMTAFMYAPAFNNASGTLFLSGYNTATTSVEIFISGENYSKAASGTIFTKGHDEAYIESELYIFGKE